MVAVHSAYLTRQGPCIQLREPITKSRRLFQYLQMWMESRGAVNKTAPQVGAWALWMGWQFRRRQSELIREKRRANKLFFCRERLTGFTAWAQLSTNTATCDVNNAGITSCTVLREESFSLFTLMTQAYSIYFTIGRSLYYNTHENDVD